MDKGLDIATLRKLLSLHASVYADPRALAELCVDSADLPDALERVLSRLQQRAIPVRSELGDRALAWLDAPSRRALTFGSSDYPALLRSLAHPPVVLFVDGNPDALRRPQIAVVGSRRATPAGLDIARQLARDLAARGVAVTSGLAVGVDAAAHLGALEGGGPTVAVLGTAIDRIYPHRHRGLADEIRDNGALVSEFPFETPPLPAHFPRRNRLISGLSRGTVVVEAALRSGSISTATHALEQGREVFAVPGSIRSPASAGCHVLIKQGARLLESVDDIFDELPELVGPFAPRPAISVVGDDATGMDVEPALSRRILGACGWEPVSLDEVVLRCGLTVPEVSSILLRLELAGIIKAQGSGCYLRIR